MKNMATCLSLFFFFWKSMELLRTMMFPLMTIFLPRLLIYIWKLFILKNRRKYIKVIIKVHKSSQWKRCIIFRNVDWSSSSFAYWAPLTIPYMWTQSWWSSSPGHCPRQDPIPLQHPQSVGDALEINCPLDGFWSTCDSVRWSVKTAGPHYWPSSSSATRESYYQRRRWFVMRSYHWKIWPLKKKPCINASCAYPIRFQHEYRPFTFNSADVLFIKLFFTSNSNT